MDLMVPAYCGGVRKPSERTYKKYHDIFVVAYKRKWTQCKYRNKKYGKLFSTMHGL